MSGQDIDVTLERIALIRRLVVAWNTGGEGAPIVHPDAPYGSAAWDEDIANVTGDDEGAAEEHRAVGAALAAFVRHAVLKPGRYTYHNPLEKLDTRDVGDVFRDAGTGRSPAQITFDVTAEHLRLIPHLAVAWDEAWAVPAVDTARPYGGTDLAATMAGHLGVAPGETARLDRLHHEMQPALQIFLRYADIAPGLYR
ncbi:hypothetical protein [Methylobacterium nigriterrae]|uniref:hypothetical protein n=1 Tax=Methylobacterium nigriterrae TaxID=3127512 RepID=UPI003014187F